MIGSPLHKAMELAKELSRQQNHLYALLVAIQDRVKEDRITSGLTDLAIDMIRNGQAEPELLQCLHMATTA